MGKKSWGETLRTTGVKFRSESEVPGWHSALCIVPPWHIVPDGSKKKILTRREYFASDLYANDLPPGFFTHFGRPTAENYELVFLTVVRPIGAFDRRETKT